MGTKTEPCGTPEFIYSMNFKIPADVFSLMYAVFSGYDGHGHMP